jgi:hypothetical protein
MGYIRKHKDSIALYGEFIFATVGTVFLVVGLPIATIMAAAM